MPSFPRNLQFQPLLEVALDHGLLGRQVEELVAQLARTGLPRAGEQRRAASPLDHGHELPGMCRFADLELRGRVLLDLKLKGRQAGVVPGRVGDRRTGRDQEVLAF